MASFGRVVHYIACVPNGPGRSKDAGAKGVRMIKSKGFEVDELVMDTPNKIKAVRQQYGAGVTFPHFLRCVTTAEPQQKKADSLELDVSVESIGGLDDLLRHIV